MAVSDNSLMTNYKIALEALRNGVPNREAVRALGCNQPRATARFTEMLNAAEAGGECPDAMKGMLVSGDFGTGKSHLLTSFQNQALARGFVCSKIVVSKETPLYDLGKAFVSAVENGQVQDRGGRLIEELALALNADSEEGAAFSKWANAAADNGALHPMFPASLAVHQQLKDPELNVKIESFWAGDRLGVRELRSGLREIGRLRDYTFRAPKVSDLPPHRLRFVLALIKAAGYKGWAVLIDEIELVGSYGILQRGRSYAEIARWMGRAAGESYPGLMVAGTVTDDFALAVISPDGQKKDRDYIRPKLESNPRHSGIAALAETGIRILERENIPLDSPTDADVNDALQNLRKIYSAAYDWNAPPIADDDGGAGFRRRMRYKIRAAINEWDLMRIYPDYKPDTLIDEFNPSYDENTDLERESKDGD